MSTARSLSQNLEAQVKCPVCLEQYQDPRILPCLHTYCKICLKMALVVSESSQSTNLLKCPECREEFQLDDVNALSVNIWVNQNIELLKQYQTENQKDEALPLCSSCKETAIAKCFNCKIFMCDNCTKTHRLIANLTEDHQLMTIEEIAKKGVSSIKRMNSCGKHQGKTQKLFCHKCDTLICKDCTLIDHKDHEFAFIADVIGQRKEKIQREVDKVGRKRKNTESTLKRVENMQESVKKNEETLKKVIDTEINQRIAILEQKRTELINELTDLTTIKMKRLSLKQEGLEVHLAGLASAVDFIQKILVHGSNHDVLSMKDILSSLSELSAKEVDDEVKVEDKLFLEVEDTTCFTDVINNSFVIKDRSVPYPEKCTLSWFENNRAICLHVKNCLDEPINIHTKRISIKIDSVLFKYLVLEFFIKCTKIQGKIGVFRIDGPLERRFSGSSAPHCKSFNLDVYIDGNIVGYLPVFSRLSAPQNPPPLPR